MEIKTPLKHPFTNHLTTEGLTRTEIFGLNVSGGEMKTVKEQRLRLKTTLQTVKSFIFIYI